MLYRPFGTTGEQISSLGYGCMRLPELETGGKWSIDDEKAVPMLQKAYERGVNYFDTAPFYCHENSEITVGKALHDIRDKVMISTKCPMGDEIKQPGDYRRWLEKSLRKLDTDYVDFYHFWGIGKDVFDQKIVGMDLLNEAKKAKEEGLIRHISFSFHDKPEVIRHIIDTSLERGVPMETMLVQYNLLDRSNEEMITYAASKGMGTVAMGPVGGGRLSAPTDLYKRLTGKEPIATYELAFKFVLGHPHLCCALSGMGTMEMVEQNAKIGSDSTPITQEEWKQLGESAERLKKFSDLYCTGCAYCQPCPAGINIPHLFNMFTYHNVYGLTDHAKGEFNRYKNDGGKLLADCKNCGKCEKKCPQHLNIRKELDRVEAVLQKL